MRRAAFVVAVVAAVSIGAVGIGSTGEPGPFTLTVAPTVVTPPGSVTGNGTGCNESQFYWDSTVYTRVEWSITGPQPGGNLIASGQVNPVTDPSGSWTTGPVTIAAGTTPGTYHLNATCFLYYPNNNVAQADYQGGGPACGFVGEAPAKGYEQMNGGQSCTYEPAPFQVIAPAATTPPPSVQPADDEEEEPAAALPASEVRGQPTFTG